MRLRSKAGLDESYAQVTLSCPLTGVLVVTVYDLVTGKKIEDATVELIAPAASISQRTAAGTATFTAEAMDEPQIRCRIRATVGQHARVADALLVGGKVSSTTIFVGAPTLEIQKKPVAPKDRAILERIYAYFMSYAAIPNVYDDFKKVDHKYRNTPGGPAAEVPVVLACERADGRQKAELDALRTAFCEIVRRMNIAADGPRAEPLAFDLVPNRDVGCFEVYINPAWIKGKIRLSLTGGTAPAAELLLVSTDPRGESAVPLPHELVYIDQNNRFHVKMRQAGAGTLKAELLEAENVESQARPIATAEVPIRSLPPLADAEKHWLFFKKRPFDFEAFYQVAHPFTEDLVKLVRVASLYWYSDTGDVLMNAHLRGRLPKCLEERVFFLTEYYKKTGGDKPLFDKLPDGKALAMNMVTYQRQIGIHAAALQETLESDFLPAGGPDDTLYRGLSLMPADLGNKFQPGSTAQLRGFSSAAVDARVAYHFMADNAADLNKLHEKAGTISIPILIRIKGGAQHGRRINPYSLHSGESEVLFKDGIYPTNRSTALIRAVGNGPFKVMKITDTADPTMATDAGFVEAMSLLKQNAMQQQLISVKLKMKHESALKEGASETRQFPKGDDPRILLVSSSMAPG